MEAADAFEAVRVIARACAVDVNLRSAHHLPWHPGRCAEVVVDGRVVGHAGQLHPAVIERCGLPKGRARSRSISTPSRSSSSNRRPGFPLPAVFQDISLVVAAGRVGPGRHRRGTCRRW